MKLTAEQIQANWEIFLGDVKLNELLITEGHAVEYFGGKR